MKLDHDRLFKELLTNFFVEFIDLFLPDVGRYVDRGAVLVSIDKEVFTDVTSGDKHEVDLLMKVKFHGSDAFFLAHIENQSTTRAGFPKRMFRYFSRQSEKFDLPVYPVVIYSHNTPRRAEPNHYEVRFPDRKVLRFEYAVVQLNQLSWRQFVNQDNPIAGALMAKMNVSKEERPKVKLECLRLIARLKLDPARSKLIGGFIESYLKLTEQEMKQYQRELVALEPKDKDNTMALISSWEQKGIEKGKLELVGRLLQRRFGSEDLNNQIGEQLTRLSAAQLDKLGEALLDFTAVADLEKWIKRHKRRTSKDAVRVS